MPKKNSQQVKSQQVKLTERAVEALAPHAGAQYVAWDREPKGFGVRVSPAGTKTYIMKFRTKAGRQRLGTIARVEDLSLDDARDKAFYWRGLVAAGKDPLQEIDASRGAVTVADAAERFLAEYVEAKRKPTTLRAYQQIIDAIIRPRLGTIPIRELSTDDVVRLHYRLRATPYQANRTLAVISKLLAWSMSAKLREPGPNPCRGIDKYPERKRRRYLDGAEYARLGAALTAAKTTQTIGLSVLTAIELLLLTGARPVEIASLRWHDVDLRSAALNLPDSKTGAKTIHLSPGAVRLLKRWPRWVGSPYVFPGNGRRATKGIHLHPSTLTHAWEDLRTDAGLENCRLYDACRHSFASVGLARGLTLAQLGEQLGHSQPATTARYAHLQDEIAKRNAAAIGGSIASALKRRQR